MNSEFQIFNDGVASSNSSNFDSEYIYYASIDSMIHNFWDTSKIKDFDNIIYSIAPS
jgi:hypothetical protein